ncbi:thiol oxidoreductase [Shewanella sp. Choline-02u-19]|uniref:di-heme oxidoredictase family protein n=1 Tax=unclassified Shewanella TaxID=196818 RepID=UPI000C346817|nr:MULTISPECIES: di-heme oxidoredictase family protein [unclassified Shewanella]PKH56696.1 thiol oxidoreductase [Shewanella sp. Bg11-22]PKI30247.1 thiol oxidoreductase [Shewanella sp. Choline-02u-19]
MIIKNNKINNTNIKLNIKVSALVIASVLSLSACGGSGDETTPTPEEKVYPSYTDITASGGDTTTFDASESGHGFSTPSPNLTAAELELHLEGDLGFETAFTTAPNDAHPELDGLGPVFNNTDCNSCHQRDGRNSTPQIAAGKTRIKLGSEAGIFLRISKAPDEPCLEGTAANNYCAPIAVPDFGDQLFHRGVLKARPDWEQNKFIGQADVYLSYETKAITYSDGSSVTLKKPLFDVENPYDAPGETKSSANVTSNLLQDDVLMGWRNGMPVFGLGLLEAIPEADIVAKVDSDDANNDGISGRANYVFDAVKAQAGDSNPVSLGRFGWKANTPSVRVQSLGALRGDIGITNPLFPDESIKGTSLHDHYLTRSGFVDTGAGIDGEPEADAEFSDSVVFYAETLAVPARRRVADADVREGARLFERLNCSGCHTPSFVTKASGDIGGAEMIAGHKSQTIYPFTDMLLHDMGEGLADGRPDFLADGSEWRTRPLWGIGLTKTVNPQAGFLHDGRAATLEEAILWHGGEAQQSTDDFMALNAAERAQVVDFLMSL